MNIRDLKYLIALMEHQHFGKAAEACFVSQPALSMQIKKLEASLGVTLLERSNKPVMLTDIGKKLCEHAHQILYQVDEMYELAKNEKDPYSSELKLGVIPTLAPYLLPHIMPVLAKKFPRLLFYLVEEQTHVLVEKLKSGKLDAALLALPVNESNFHCESLFKEEFLLAVSHAHPLAKRKTISQADLKDKTLLLLEEGHCLRDQALDICFQVKASESVSFRATSLETLRHMVAMDTGMTLIPRLAQKKNDGISYLSFVKHKPSREIALCWRKSSVKVDLLKELAELVSEIDLSGSMPRA